LLPKLIESFARKFWSEMAGGVNPVDTWRIFKSITFSCGADWVMMQPRIWWLFVQGATKKLIGGQLNEMVPIAATSISDAPVQTGQTYCKVVKAVTLFGVTSNNFALASTAA
jgi:hypothetical protein